MSKIRNIATILGKTEVSNTAQDALITNGLPDGWTATKDSSNSLVFSYNDSNLIKFQDSGTVQSITDIVAYGTV